MVKDQIRSLPALRRSSVTLASAAQVLLEATDEDDQTDANSVWDLLRAEGMRERLLAAVQVVKELSPFGEDDPSREQVELVKRYATVRPFLPFASTLPLRSIEVGAALLQAVAGLGALVGRKRVERAEIVDDVVGGVWRQMAHALAGRDSPAQYLP